MANSNLTPTAVTREILRVAHEKLSFIGTIERQYDDSFAKTGAKIGDTLKIRLPNKYTVRTGKTIQAQDNNETSVSLTVATQKGVDMNFSSAELTLDIDDFSKRIIVPAVAALTSDIEATMLSTVTKEVYNSVGSGGTAPVFLSIAQAKAKLNQNLAPKDDMRCLQMESVDMAASVNELKGLFHESSEISKQYREGKVGKATGLMWYENERVYRHANGSDVTGITFNSVTAADGDATLAITGASAAPSVGTVFTMADVYAVHPETKVAYTHLQQFVVTAATTASLSFSPALQSTGASQNVSVLPATTAALVFVSAATTAYPQNLAYHKEAFAFATADLELPSGVHFAAREQEDGISIRLVRQYDINNDMFPTRLDILHGYKAIRPEWACRLPGKGS
jgi:hypothetical protein